MPQPALTPLRRYESVGDRPRLISPRHRNPGRPLVWLVGRDDEGRLDSLEVERLPEGVPYMVPDWWTSVWGPFSAEDKEVILSGRRKPHSHEAAIRASEEAYHSPSSEGVVPLEALWGSAPVLHEVSRPVTAEIVLLTVPTAKQLAVGTELRLYDRACPHGGRTGCWKRVRVSGRPRVWVRSPDRVAVPVKYGLYQSLTVTEDMIRQGRVGRVRER